MQLVIMFKDMFSEKERMSSEYDFQESLTFARKKTFRKLDMNLFWKTSKDF